MKKDWNKPLTTSKAAAFGRQLWSDLKEAEFRLTMGTAACGPAVLEHPLLAAAKARIEAQRALAVNMLLYAEGACPWDKVEEAGRAWATAIVQGLRSIDAGPHPANRTRH